MSFPDEAAGYMHVCPHCAERMILPGPGGPPQARLLRRPPRPPIFGLRIHPLVLLGALLALVAAGLIIALATNPNFLPGFNPFPGGTPGDFKFNP